MDSPFTTQSPADNMGMKEEALVQEDASIRIDPHEARKILMKTDAVILTFIVALAFMMFLDKNSLPYASILVQLAWKYLHFGYLVGMPISAYLITKVPVGRLLGGAAICWGVVLMCMAACQNFAGLATVRFLLGLIESPAFPSAMILIGNWWRRSEQPLRAALWYNTFAGVFGALLAYAINNIHGDLANWRYLFIIYGTITILLGILAFFFLPVSPAQAWFLTPHEKAVAIARLADTQQKNNNDRPTHFQLNQVFEALRSGKYWTLLLFVLAQGVTAAGITNFNPLIIKGFGFSTQRTNLLAAPQAAVGIIAQVLCSILAYYLPNTRCLWWILGTLPALAGAIIIHSANISTQRPLALGGVYLMGFYNVGFVMAIAIATANTRGSTKRPFVNASMGIALSVAEIIGPQFFRNSQAPVYELGIWALVVSYAVMIATGGLYWGLAIVSNRKRDRKGWKADSEEEAATDEDLTDGQNKVLRYSY